MKPIRAALPYLMGGAFFLVLRSGHSGAHKALACGLAAGLALLWSNDFAYVTAGVFSLAFCDLVLGRAPVRLRACALYALTLLASGAALYSLATAFSPLALLRYNFLDVARDQWWYFGPYAEAARVLSLVDAGKLFTPAVAVSSVAPLCALWRSRQEDGLGHRLLFCMALATFLAACVASVGGHLGEYFTPYVFFCAALAVVYALRFVQERLPSAGPKTARVLRAVALCLLMAVCALSVASLMLRTARAKQDAAHFYVPELGGYLGVEWRDYVEFARANRDVPALEEYWGVFSAVSGRTQTWPVDSVIHALGSKRELCAGLVPGAEILVTSRAPMSFLWQAWSLCQNYWFYRQLLEGYAPVMLSPSTIVWRRAQADRFGPAAPVTLDQARERVLVHAPAPGLYEVELAYRYRAAGRNLLLVRNNISFVVGSGGYQTLDPERTSARFPVYIPQAGEFAVDSFVLGSGGHELLITAAAARRVALTDEEAFHLLGAVPDFQSEQGALLPTDAIWRAGVSRSTAAFLLPDSEVLGSAFSPGRVVMFADGGLDVIRSQRREGGHLLVELGSGKPLAPAAGLPCQYVIVGTAPR